MSSKTPKSLAKKSSKKVLESPEAKPSSVQSPKSNGKASAKVEAAEPGKNEIGEHHMVNMQQVFRASRALKVHTKNLLSKPGLKTQLLATESPITVEILLHKVPIKANMKRKCIPLAKPIRNQDTTEICAFVRDAKTAKLKLQLQSAPNIKKVIDLAKLRTHYNQYEARRTLAQSYDLFICEETILPDVCRQLGSSFLRIRKAPVAFTITTRVSDTIVKIRDSTLFDLSAGVTQSYKIGDTGFTEAELCKNFEKSIDEVVKKLPMGWSNVKQIALISSGSAPLPVYNNITPPAPKTDSEATSSGPSKAGSNKKADEKKTAKAAKGKREAPSTASEDADIAAPSPKKVVVSDKGKAVAKKSEDKLASPKAEPSKAPSTPKAVSESSKKTATNTPVSKKSETPSKPQTTETPKSTKSATSSPATKNSSKTPTKSASTTPSSKNTAKSPATPTAKKAAETKSPSKASDAKPKTPSSKPATPSNKKTSSPSSSKKK